MSIKSGDNMNINQIVTGRNSFYFFVGYFVLLCGMILQSSVKTSFYMSILSSIRESPFVSLIASVPFIYIVGIITDTTKDIIKRKLFKAYIYNSENIPKVTVDALNMIAENELNLSKDIGFDVKLLSVKNIMLPDFDSYRIQQRWLHDFLENVIFMSIISFFVVCCRFIAFSWDNLDWVIIVSSMSLTIFSYAKLDDLKLTYTSIDLGLILREYALQCQNDFKNKNLIFHAKLC
jgi:hypothetical protein